MDELKERRDEALASREITLTVNGRKVRGHAPPRRLLSDFLRDELGLKGCHVGCEHGACGACTVLLGGRPVRSCLMFAVQAEGAEILTVEGLEQEGRLTPLQELFSAHHALQCGFCTPGMLLGALALLREHPSPTEGEVREALSGHLCRCTGYEQIVRAVVAAGQEGGL